MSNLLINEPPLMVIPTLAKKIGLNEAIVIQQIHFWININRNKKSGHHHIDGRWWTYNTMDGWQDQFGWWDKRTVRRILKGLRENGLLIAEAHGGAFDRTLWYTIDYDLLGQVVRHDTDKLSTSHPDILCNVDPDKLSTSTYTETNNTENNRKVYAASAANPPHIQSLQQMEYQNPSHRNAASALRDAVRGLGYKAQGVAAYAIEELGLSEDQIVIGAANIAQALKGVCRQPGPEKFAEGVCEMIAAGATPEEIERRVPAFTKKQNKGVLMYPSQIVLNWDKIKNAKSNMPFNTGTQSALENFIGVGHD